MFSHATLGTVDLDAARRFYEPLARALGLELKFSDERWMGVEVALGGQAPLHRDAPSRRAAHVRRERSDDRLPGGQPIRRGPVPRAGDRERRNLRGQTGAQTEYHPNYYGAYFRDPDGNKLCVCCHRAE